MLKGVAMPAGKPNILVIWADDIGITNLSCYSDGLMGYRTPNIDRIAEEGMRFTDAYGEQSCTAGRSAFITGQSVYRTGLSKVGLPGVDVGLQPEDPTIAGPARRLGPYLSISRNAEPDPATCCQGRCGAGCCPALWRASRSSWILTNSRNPSRW
jgi:hypothetical protein